MAIRPNTLEYAFATRTTSLATATRHDFTAVTVVIDENTSRTFRSVYVEFGWRGAETTGTAVTAWLVGVKIDAVAFSDQTKTQTLTNTGDQQAQDMRSDDFASYFNTNFTGTSHSVQVGVQVTGPATINHYAKLVITYEYDDAAQTTRTKTVRIPIESGTTTLTATLAEIGTNQIPQLTGAGSPFCPESTITLRDLFFDIFANEGHASGTTDDQLGVEIDSEGETLFGSLEQALDSSPWMRVLWKRTDLSTTAAHAFRARGTTTGRLPQLGAILTFTYSYDHDASTAIINSIDMGMPAEAGTIGGTSSGNQSKVGLTFQIQEPATIALKQSGIIFTFNAPNAAVTGLNVAVGGQTHRAYTPLTANASPAGQHTLVHRFDSGGAAGLGLSIARGENTLTLGFYRTSTGTGTAGYGPKARAILNYSSGKASGGAGTHNITTKTVGWGTTAVGAVTVYDGATFAPSIPESAYWTTHVGYEMQYLHAGKGEIAVAAERASGEGVADGWQPLDTHNMGTANEIGCYSAWFSATDAFDRHPGELDTKRLGVETSRVYRISSFNDPATAHGGWSSLVMTVTRHAITSTVSGTVSGYAGAGGSIVVTAHRVDTGEALYQATTSAGGGYSFTAYSTTDALFAAAREDATHVGRSNNFTPS